MGKVNEENNILLELLIPFTKEWQREVVFRRRSNAFDIYYVPWTLPIAKTSTNGLRPKRRLYKELEDYFNNFPDEELTLGNFSYVRKQLRLFNDAFETICNAKTKDPASISRNYNKALYTMTSLGDNAQYYELGNNRTEPCPGTITGHTREVRGGKR